MPNKDVTITPVFVQGVPFVNMPTAQSNNITITLPEEVTTFKIYDDGGAVGNYSDNVDGTIEMRVPNGYTLKMTGSIDTEVSSCEFFLCRRAASNPSSNKR